MILNPGAGIAAVALAGGAVIVLAGLAIVSKPKSWGRLELCLLGLAVLTAVLRVAAAIHFTPIVSSDEGLLAQAAATLVVHGHDPYGTHLTAATRVLRANPFLVTPLMSGGWVTTVQYPGLALLIVAAGVWLTHGVESIVVTDAAAMSLTIGIVFLLLPRHLRTLGIVTIMALPGLNHYVLAGIVVVLAMPLLALAVWRWDAIGVSGRLEARGAGQAAALGLACGVTQLAWLLFPFLLLAVWRTNQSRFGAKRSTAICLRLTAVTAASFGVVNLPFGVASPHAWAVGIGAPLFQAAIPYGFGAPVLPLLAHVGGGYLRGYAICAALSYLSLLFVAWLWLRQLRCFVLVLPILPILSSMRASTEYWELLVPIWLVAALTVEGRALPSFTPSFVAPHRTLLFAKGALVALTGAAVVELALAVSSPAPLLISVGPVTAVGHRRYVSELSVRLTNRSGIRLSPHFVVSVEAGQMVWQARGGPSVIRPHGSGVYRLVAPSTHGLLPVGPFVVEALTGNPETLSSSNVQFPK